MSRVAIISVAAAALLAADAAGQGSTIWKVRGDTAGAPRGCSAAAAISAIDAFISALRNADSAALERVVARQPRDRFVFSTGGFTPADTFVTVRSVRDLVRYARLRARRHERLVVQEVTFNGWRDRGLEFGPIYFARSADDLGTTPRPGIGKGEYWCGQGLSAFNTAPRPSADPGPGF